MAKAKQETAIESPAADGVMLVAIEPIRLDGVDFAPGETFSAFASDAESLVATGAAQPASPGS